MKIQLNSSLTQHPMPRAYQAGLLLPGCTLHINQFPVPPVWYALKLYFNWIDAYGFQGPSSSTLISTAHRAGTVPLQKLPSQALSYDGEVGKRSLAGADSRESSNSNKKNYQHRSFLLYFPLLLLIVHQAGTE